MALRDSLVAEQRRLRVEELAVVAVLDERGAVDDTLASVDGVSVRDARSTVETARALSSLPEVAAVAHAGQMSDQQLREVAQLADAESDAEWAERAPHTLPADLARMARCARTPSEEEARARRRTRGLHGWWDNNTKMFRLGGAGLPDLDGALVDTVFNHMIDRMRPPKGQPWASRAQRMADALVELARNYADVEAVEHPCPLFVVEVPLVGPAELNGVPLPAGMVESLRASAKIEPVLVDEHGARVATGRVRTIISAKVRAAVLRRDGHCRFDCDRRHGLQVHHLWPRSWGGNDDPANLAGVCVGGGTDHHGELAPHGPYLLLGNPNRPDGLRIVHRDELPTLAALTGVEAVLDLNGHSIITDVHELDRALQRIRAGPTAA